MRVEFLPPSVMLPPRRLEALLTQSIEYQCDKCLYHNANDIPSVDEWSFLRDHSCSKYTHASSYIHPLIRHPLPSFNFLI